MSSKSKSLYHRKRARAVRRVGSDRFKFKLPPPTVFEYYDGPPLTPAQLKYLKSDTVDPDFLDFRGSNFH